MTRGAVPSKPGVAIEELADPVIPPSLHLSGNLALPSRPEVLFGEGGWLELIQTISSLVKDVRLFPLVLIREISMLKRHPNLECSTDY